MSDLLRRAALAFEADPSRMAAALAAHRAQTGTDEAALAAWLGVDLDRLHGLALCARPAHASPPRAADVAALAAFVGCDRDRLGALLTAFPDKYARLGPAHRFMDASQPESDHAAPEDDRQLSAVFPRSC